MSWCISSSIVLRVKATGFAFNCFTYVISMDAHVSYIYLVKWYNVNTLILSGKTPAIQLRSIKNMWKLLNQAWDGHWKTQFSGYR